ncbi:MULTISPECIES: S41 family peptidase [Maribacter]|uniref:S41 family peptidase n=1 Tax=Maribacter flavus TaxID=1658664 RepID=A0ABU7IHP2_9FLAO|nr:MULTISPECIES: S41 family peptidase [Maribacter]MDC6405060.1 S41 family peptidase [Maribacter sp. PR66]MEE1972474.1 S41 family peptidase [Maribacter flavus]
MSFYFIRKVCYRKNLVLVVLTISQSVLAQQFSKAQILSDLAYLKKSLKETHFNLYAYTTNEAFNRNYHKVRQNIKKDSFTSLDAKKIFQQVVSAVNNGHTRVPFPIPEYITYAQNGGTLFPLEVAIEDGNALVRKNWSSNTNITTGSELLSINGKHIKKVFEKVYPQISAERLYFKHAQLENLSLPRFYWLAYGEQQSYEVEILVDGQRLKYTLKPINTIEDFEMKRDDILKHDRHLSFLKKATAYIRPGDFGGDLELFKHFIDSSFIEIKNKNSENLIVDLRNHSGGDDAFGDYLVSYIADKPFKWASRFQLKTSKALKDHTRKHQDTIQAYWQSVLSHKDGEIYDYEFDNYRPQPSSKRFKGKVYVLVNRQSYSQSTVTASQIKDYGWGTVVGEETAEFPNLYASIYSYNLPKTGIKVEVSKGKIERVNGIDTGKGLMPEIEIKDHLLDDKDEILEKLLNRI